MTFYFKPPRGTIELDKMLDCLRQRLDFISSLTCGQETVHNPENLSYFVEGTAIDRASHYLLRLISLHIYSFQQHVIKAETALFKRRLKFCDLSHFELILKTCKQHCNELLNTRKDIHATYSRFLEAVKYLCCDILRKPTGLKHAFAKPHPESCDSMFIRVPYRICLKLVASRKAELRSGEALVPCGIWRQLLVELFQLHLLYGYEDMQISGCHREALADPRISQLSQMMSLHYKKFEFGWSSSGNHDKKSDLTRQRLTERHRMFPPCVTSMLDSLRKHHRIGHHARVALTLILKESGMPLNEALAFWKSELSMPECKHGKHGSGCSHSWQKDERKFTYSVRHMYGLEGACKNYAAPSCATIQGQILAPGSLGGCPFSRQTEETLLPMLGLYKCSQPDEVLTLAHKNKPVQACQRLLQDCLGQIPKSSEAQLPSVNFSKPSQFYSICRDWSIEF